MESNKRLRLCAVRRGSKLNNTLQLGEGICFVYVKVHDNAVEQALANINYTLRGLESGVKINGTTDQEGILRHEYLPDDDYELDCQGVTEFLETYYMDDASQYEGNPWFLLLHTGQEDSEDD